MRYAEAPSAFVGLASPGASMEVCAAPPSVPLGRIKSFGPLGPKYQVGPVLRPLDDGDWLIEVTMVESGEAVEYRWTHLLDDPDAR
jgi:hypothetical protein